MSDMPAFPTKRISVSGIIRDASGNLLIVRPAYREGWLLPGGIVEPDESPVDALRREVREELGIDTLTGKLRCVDYLTARDGYAESIHLMFDCATPSQAELDMIAVDGIEILAYKLVHVADATGYLVPSLASRLKAVEAGHAGYFQNGHPAN